MKKNILITGGAGYIGSCVANFLLENNYSVTIIDNLITGNIDFIPKSAKFEKCDIDDEIKISKIISKTKFDAVIHFAGLIRVDESVKKPEKYFIQLNKNIHSNNIYCDIGLLKRAYYFSFDRHLNQVRESGEPFASHPYAVANILINLKLDYQSIITALLHDTIEDGVATNDEIKKYFGLEINELVEGLSLIHISEPTRR